MENPRVTSDPSCELNPKLFTELLAPGWEAPTWSKKDRLVDGDIWYIGKDAINPGRLNPHVWRELIYKPFSTHLSVWMGQEPADLGSMVVVIEQQSDTFLQKYHQTYFEYWQKFVNSKGDPRVLAGFPFVVRVLYKGIPRYISCTYLRRPKPEEAVLLL